MARREIIQYGDPVLRKVTSRVIKFDKSLRKLIEDMFETMYASDGIGLAAPQIGVSKRVLVCDVTYPNERYKDEETGDEKPHYSPVVLVNPVIIQHEDEMVSYEGCLSFPNVFFEVKRYKKIAIRYQDILGKERRMICEDDILCRCLQHEIDHLDGKLFVDKPTDEIKMKTALEENELAGIKSPPPTLLVG